jgi:hypothetical protein
MRSLSRQALPALALPALALVACAHGAPVAERSFVRADLGELPLVRVDVVVVASTPQATGPRFEVETFAPPALEAPLAAPAEDVETREALREALEAALAARGFRTRSWVLGTAGAEALPVAPLPLSDTSTRPSGVQLTLAPAPGPGVLSARATLRDALAASDADAVLVVRAVPVDAFHLMEAGRRGPQIDPTLASVAQQLPAESPVRRSGRLLVGQAFLFERSSGLRLFSRQLPDFPSDGRLTADARILRQGLVEPAGSGPLSGADRARRSAPGFVKVVLDGLPGAQVGREEERQRFAREDALAEAQREAFLDQGHLGLEFGVRGSAERAGATLREGPALDTKAVAPAGVWRVVPRLAWQRPGGLTFAVALPVGFAPGQFSRSYFRDATNTAPGASAFGATLKLDGVATAGAEASVGWTFAPSPSLLFAPAVGAFFDVWMLSVSPAALLSDRHLRFGVLAEVSALLRPDPSGPLFLRGGAGLRLGGDDSGPPLFALDVSASVGLFL